MAEWHSVDHVHIKCQLYPRIPRFIMTSQIATMTISLACCAITCSQQLDYASEMTHIVTNGAYSLSLPAARKGHKI